MKTLLASLLFLISTSFFSQQVWVQTYNGTNNGSDYGTDVAVDNGGNIYVCGATWVQGSNNESVLIKYSPAGVKLWEQRITTPGNNLAESANAIALDTAGNIYIAGKFYSSSYPSGFIAKYSPSGVNLYAREFDRGGGYDDEFYAIAVDNAGNLYVTGYCEGFDSQYDICIIKFNSASTTLWAKYYTNPLHREDRGYDIKLDQSGNVYVAGFVTDSVSIDRKDAMLLKYDNAGNFLWKQGYRGSVSGLGAFNSLDIDQSGNVYAGGYSPETTTGNQDLMFAKYKPDGTREWLKTQHGNTGDVVKDIKSDNSFIYITGSLGPDILTAKYDPAGNQQWQKFYNGPANLGDQGYELAVDNSGNVYSVGMTLPANFLNDAVIVKYNSTGDQQWANVYSGSSNRFDSFTGVSIDPAGYVVAAGGCENSTNLTSDILLIKYNPVIGITPIGNTVPAKYSLSQNYPNPFNPVTNIQFAVPKASLVKIVIYDIIGREVETLVSNQLKAGTYRVDFDGSNVTSGIYFYRLEASDFSQTKRMILVK